jgi:hypothetical protein
VIVLPAAAVPTGVGVPVPAQAVITIEAMNAIAANERVDRISTPPMRIRTLRSRASVYALGVRPRRAGPRSTTRRSLAWSLAFGESTRDE